MDRPALQGDGHVQFSWFAVMMRGRLPARRGTRRQPAVASEAEGSEAGRVLVLDVDSPGLGVVLDSDAATRGTVAMIADNGRVAMIANDGRGRSRRERHHRDADHG